MKVFQIVFILICFSVAAQEHVVNTCLMGDDSIQKIIEPVWITLADGTKAEVEIGCNTLQVFIPKKANGAGILLIPGGSLYTLLSDTEGVQVAQWLQERGMHVYLYRYKLKPSTNGNYSLDAMRSFAFPSDYDRTAKDEFYIQAIKDAGTALEKAKADALSRGLNPKKLGLMGFSIGASIALELTISAVEKPFFLVSMNGFTVKDGTPKPALPPAFIGCDVATSLQEAMQSTKIFQKYYPKSPDTELHIYTSEHNLDKKRLWEPGLEKWLSSRVSMK